MSGAVIHGAHDTVIGQELESLSPELEAEIPLGMEAAFMSLSKLKITISTVAISAFVFLLILAWFEFMQTTFYSWSSPTTETGPPSSDRLWYALLVTLVSICLIALIFLMWHR